LSFVIAISGKLKVEVKKRRPHRRYKGITVLSGEDIPSFLLSLK
jgi:hypothetical protein